MQFPSFFVEQSALTIYSSIAGIDEVGRGCLFGPVVAGIVVITKPDQYIYGVRDSKQMTALQREKFSEKIKATVTAHACGMATAEEVDNDGIVQATLKAMLRAYWSLPFSPDVIMMDGESSTKPILGKTYQFTKGDALYFSISAASVIAKVYRDSLMADYANEYPEYDLDSNKGYGTPKHIEALKQHGISKLHRKSFLKFLS